MAKPVDVDAAALEELHEAAAKMESEVEGLGSEFVAEVRATFRRVGETPEAFTLVRELPGARSAPVKRFRYRVFFVERSDHIRVLAIARSARRPGYWRDRAD